MGLEELLGGVQVGKRLLGNRQIAVARELTKLHEEITRGNLPELAQIYGEKDPPKGEAVIVVGPPGDDPADIQDVDALLVDALSNMSVRDAAATVAAATDAPRRDVYRRALEISRSRNDDGE